MKFLYTDTGYYKGGGGFYGLQAINVDEIHSFHIQWHNKGEGTYDVVAEIKDTHQKFVVRSIFGSEIDAYSYLCKLLKEINDTN